MAEHAVLKRFELPLDLKAATPARHFEVVEGDTGNVLVITLTDGGEPVELEDTTVKLMFSSGQGVAVQEDESLTVEANVLTVKLYPGSYSPGLVECEVQIYSLSEDGADQSGRRRELVTSARFSFNCRRAILNGESIHASPGFPLLTQLIEDVEAAEALRDSNEQARLAAEVMRRAYEQARQAAETARQLAEEQRASAEEARAAAELQRIRNEAVRASGEDARDSAENARAAAETAREDAEAVRAAAETEREEIFAQMMEEGAGIKVVNDPPGPSTQGSVGDAVFSVRSGRAYICTAEGSAQTLRPYEWRPFAYRNDWVKLKDLTLTANGNTFEVSDDLNGDPFLFDELRVTVLGHMTGATSVNITVNGESARYIRDNTFMNKDCYDVTEGMTVLCMRKAENGFISSYRESGGVMTSGSYSSAKSPQSGCLRVGNFAGYSRIKLAAATASGYFVSGTRFIVEGRNV